MKMIDNIETDVSEEKLNKTHPEILKILLLDRTLSKPGKEKNVIWANDNYAYMNPKIYGPEVHMTVEAVTNGVGDIIQPRALKSNAVQKERTKNKAEVFTPTWMVKLQNDGIDQEYINDSLEHYVKRIWLEITAGEAPYMATRYHMDSGEFIPIEQRVGFVDRKLRRINEEINDKAEWQRLTELAFKSSYGFEWSGDSLLLARENLLYTYVDYYVQKWNDKPSEGLLKEIATIISYNLFQMDGLKYEIPLSEKKEKIAVLQLDLFGEEDEEEQWYVRPGKRVKIMNWEINKMEFFDKGVN